MCKNNHVLGLSGFSWNIPVIFLVNMSYLILTVIGSMGWAPHFGSGFSPTARWLFYIWYGLWNWVRDIRIAKKCHIRKDWYHKYTSLIQFGYGLYGYQFIAMISQDNFWIFLPDAKRMDPMISYIGLDLPWSKHYQSVIVSIYSWYSGIIRLYYAIPERSIKYPL